MTRESCPGPNGEKINTITISAWPCESLCGPITGGAGSLPLTKSPRRIWASVPKTTERGFSSSGRFLEDEKKGGKNTNTTAPRNAESTGAAITHTVGKRSLPTDRWGKQSVWLAASGKRQPTQFPGGSPDPLYCQRKEKPGPGRAGSAIPPCVAPVRLRVRRLGAGQPCTNKRRHKATVRPLWAKGGNRKLVPRELRIFHF